MLQAVVAEKSRFAEEPAMSSLTGIVKKWLVCIDKAILPPGLDKTLSTGTHDCKCNALAVQSQIDPVQTGTRLSHALWQPAPKEA